MSIAKNMEAVFIFTVAMASVTGLAAAASPSKRIGPPACVQAAAPAATAVVTVTGKRLGAAQKSQLAN